MKTIYVTIAEFEENGGILEDGREIFSIGGKAYYKFNCDYEDAYQIYVIGKNGNCGTVQKDIAQVAIECTPYYK